MASGIYNRFKANLMNKVVDMEADNIYVVLLTTAHSFSATHNVLSEIIANELAQSGGYVATGTALAAKAVTQAATTKFAASNSTWTTSTFVAGHAALVDMSVGADTASNLVCSFDFGGNKEVSSGTFTIQWDTDGIITLT
jgi:hypothetical protein